MGPANLSHPVILDHNDGRPNSPLLHVVAEKFYQLLKPGCKLFKTLKLYIFFFSLIFLLPLNKLHYYIDPRWHGFETEDYEDDHTPSVGYSRLGVRMPQ